MDWQLIASYFTVKSTDIFYSVCMYIWMFTFCHRSSDLICYPIFIELHTNIGYDNTSNKFAFQGDRVKVAEVIFRNTSLSLQRLHL